MGDQGVYCEDCHNVLFPATTSTHAADVSSAISDLASAYQYSQIVDKFEENLRVCSDTLSVYTNFSNLKASMRLRHTNPPFKYGDFEGSRAILSWFKDKGDTFTTFWGDGITYYVHSSDIGNAIRASVGGRV
jgi:hypothetical protein